MTNVFIGSHGTLGLLTDLSLKIIPIPRSQRTLVVPVPDLATGLRCGQELLAVALTASSILLTHGYAVAELPSQTPYTLFYTAEGVPEDVQAELQQVREVLRRSGVPEPQELVDHTGIQAWSNLLGQHDQQGEPSLVVRISVPVRQLSNYCEGRATLLDQGAYCLDFASGFVYAVRQTHDSDEARAWLHALRQPALAQQGYAVIVAQPAALRGQLDRWGYQPASLSLMRRLKEHWDPHHILNRGAFLVDA
jgi:FAD/FMN-containing dehydrogenase